MLSPACHFGCRGSPLQSWKAAEITLAHANRTILLSEAAPRAVSIPGLHLSCSALISVNLLPFLQLPPGISVLADPLRGGRALGSLVILLVPCSVSQMGLAAGETSLLTWFWLLESDGSWSSGSSLHPLALRHPHLNPWPQDKFFQPCECCLGCKTDLDLLPCEHCRIGSFTLTCLSRQEHQSLLEKLSALEKKVIVGGVDLLAKAEEQEKLLEESNMELEERRKRAEQLRKELEEKEVGLYAVAVWK